MGKGKERKGKEREGKERKGKERERERERERKGREGKERKGKERKGKERKGKERKGKERKEKKREGKGREGKGREWKGREGKGRDTHDLAFQLSDVLASLLLLLLALLDHLSVAAPLGGGLVLHIGEDGDIAAEVAVEGRAGVVEEESKAKDGEQQDLDRAHDHLTLLKVTAVRVPPC